MVSCNAAPGVASDGRSMTAPASQHRGAKGSYLRLSGGHAGSLCKCGLRVLELLTQHSQLLLALRGGESSGCMTNVRN